MFAPGFEERMGTFMNDMRGMDPVGGRICVVQGWVWSKWQDVLNVAVMCMPFTAIRNICLELE